MTKSKVRKHAIWWAVDPFHDDHSFHEHALKVLVPFARALSTTIHPVTFIDTYRALEPSGQIFPLIPIQSEPLEALKAAAEERLTRLSKKAPKGVIGSPIILSNESAMAPSLRERVEAISSAAQKHSAIFVALQSHTHKGFKRFYMGSFAETFVLHSSSPTLVFSPKCTITSKFRQIVFPTDFSEESTRALRSLQKLFMRLGGCLSIVHARQSFLSKTVVHLQMRAELEAQERQVLRAAQKITHTAQKAGLKADSVVLPGTGSGSPSTAILDFARTGKADLIALAAQSGPIRTALLGATSRQISRDAHCPVLIYRARTSS